MVTEWPRMMNARFCRLALFLPTWCGLHTVIVIANAFRLFETEFYGA
jgi:hypothetical protein